MRTIIAGSRDFRGRARAISKIIEESGFTVSCVISGAATGADIAGEAWAAEHTVPILRFPAEWNTYGRAAGAIRNGDMATEADQLIAIWDGKSPGTLDMIVLMTQQNKPVFVYLWKTPEKSYHVKPCILQLKLFKGDSK